MNKQLIIIFFCYLTNIITKESINQHEYELDDIKAFMLKHSLSGIKLVIDKYGIKFTSSSLSKSTKNSNHTIISLSKAQSKFDSPSLYLGGNIILGDTSNPIIISPNKNIEHQIIWPDSLAVKILAINSQGQLIARDSENSTITQLGETGNNQIICNPNTPITITSHSPSNGDIILTTGPQTNGNIYITSKNIKTPSNGELCMLGINDQNQIITFSKDNPITATFHDLSAIGTISLGTYKPGISASISINNNLLQNYIQNNGIVFNGDVYFNNSGFSLPTQNQTTTLIVDSKGKIGILLSSSKFKENINNLNISKTSFEKLQPRTYNYKNNIKEYFDKENKEIGLIAEEIDTIPELRPLVIYDKDNNPLSVNYNALSVLNTHQILKNQEKIEELINIISKLQEEIKKIK